MIVSVLKAVEDFRLRSVQLKDRGDRLERTLNKHMPLHMGRPAHARRAESDAVRAHELFTALSHTTRRMIMTVCLLQMKDVLSHFFLRMAFCQTEELRRWFLSQESTLFRCAPLAAKASKENAHSRLSH